MKKGKYVKIVFTLMGIALLLTIPLVQYAATDSFSLEHEINTLLTTVGVTTPHQDTFSAYMETDVGINKNIAAYRIYYKEGENLKVKVTFTTPIQSADNVKLVLKFGENGNEHVINTYEIENDYLLFSYSIQNGDNGELLFTHFSGTVYDSDGNSVVVALPDNVNIYSNAIVADTIAPKSSYNVNTKEITVDDALYILEDNEIRNIRQSDVYLLNYEDGTVTKGVTNTISIKNSGSTIQIKTDEYDAICINAIDIAGNLIFIHYNIEDGSTSINPVISVSSDGNVVDNITYNKEGKIIRIKTWNSTNADGVKVQVAFDDGTYKNATYTGNKEDNMYVWAYTVQDGDNGKLKVKLSGNCYCNKKFESDNETIFENNVADTKAPVVTWKYMELEGEVNEKKGWGSSSLEKYDEDAIGTVNGDYYESSPAIAANTEDDAILYLSSGRPNSVYTIEDENFTYIDLNGEKNLVVYSGYVDGKDLRDPSQNMVHRFYNYDLGKNKDYYKFYSKVDLAEYKVDGEMYGMLGEVMVKDYAGNETWLKDWDAGLRIVLDWAGPNINITADEASSDDYITFTIKAEDVNYKSYNGSGVTGSVNVNDVIVQNGSIISYTNDDENNTLTLKVMAGVDGYVSVYVPAGVITDNVGNENNESEITKVKVDRTAPVIHDVTGVPANWVKEANISVIASDTGSGLAESPYSFDEGKTWQKENHTKISQNGIVTICVKDKVGLISTTTVEIQKIDTTAPSIDSIEQNQIATYETEITIKANDNQSGLSEYSFDGGKTWQTSATKTYTEATTIEGNQLMVKDAVGNIGKYVNPVYVLVNESVPTINEIIGVPTDWVREATITVIAEDAGSGLAEDAYSFDRGATWQRENYAKISENGSIIICVKNKSGYMNTVQVNIQKIDATAPTIQSIEQNQISGYATEVTIKANDNESGLSEYSFDGGATWQISATKTYTETTTIESNQLMVKDAVGNVEKYDSAVDVILNQEAPIVKIEKNGGDYVLPTDGTTARIYTTVDVDSKNDSTIYYGVSKSNTNEPTNYQNVISNRTDLSLDLTNGTWYLWVYVVDNVLNTESQKYVSNAFVIKNSTITLTADKTSLTNQDVTVKIEYGYGLVENQYAGIAERREAGLTSITLSENGTIYAEATDIAGNKVYNTLNINYIDKTAPMITLDIQNQVYTLENETINMDNNISIEEDNLEKVEYTWTNKNEEPHIWDNTFSDIQLSEKTANVRKTATVNDIGTWYLYVKATDKAGNVTISHTGEMIVEITVSFDTTSPESCIDDVKTIGEINYIIVQPKTTVKNLLENINTPSTIKIKKSDNNEVVSQDSTLCTNETMQVKDINNTYIIVVKGDITGDGIVDMRDILKINQFRNRKLELTNVEILAGNVVNTDNEINMSDILKINQYRLRKIGTL